MDWKTLPSLSALRAFDALSRHGSLSAAARDLNVTHAAIAHHLRALEAHFGQELARRDGQAMRLTPTGQELALALHEGFDRIADGIEQITRRDAERPVTVSTTPAFAEAWLMPRVGGFWAEYPDIELAIRPSVKLVDLRHDGIDVAIRFGRGVWPGLDAKPLAMTRFSVVCAPGYSKARRLEDLETLSAQDWFFSAASQEQQAWGRVIGVDFEKVGARDLANNGLVISAVRAGLGLSIQSRVVIENDLASGQLVSLFDGDPQGLGYFVVTRPDAVPSPGARLFRSWLLRAAKADDQAQV